MASNFVVLWTTQLPLLLSQTVAVQHVIAEDTIKSFHLGGRYFRRLGGDRHSIGDWGCASSNHATIHFHHACVTRLNRPELWVIADMRNRSASTVDQINERLVSFRFLNGAVDRNLHNSWFLMTVGSSAQGSRAIPRKNYQNL
jgi:hypothetical protein